MMWYTFSKPIGDVPNNSIKNCWKLTELWPFKGTPGRNFPGEKRYCIKDKGVFCTFFNSNREFLFHKKRILYVKKQREWAGLLKKQEGTRTNLIIEKTTGRILKELLCCTSCLADACTKYSLRKGMVRRIKLIGLAAFTEPEILETQFRRLLQIRAYLNLTSVQ